MEMATGLYRITQEALRNIVKHAGRAHVKVSLHSASGELILEVADSGQGFDVEKYGSGLGLVSMKERARLLGATLQHPIGSAAWNDADCESPTSFGRA